jgi:hypothetical protein
MWAEEKTEQNLVIISTSFASRLKEADVPHSLRAPLRLIRADSGHLQDPCDCSHWCPPMSRVLCCLTLLKSALSVRRPSGGARPFGPGLRKTVGSGDQAGNAVRVECSGTGRPLFHPDSVPPAGD